MAASPKQKYINRFPKIFIIIHWISLGAATVKETEEAPTVSGVGVKFISRFALNYWQWQVGCLRYFLFMKG